LSRDDVPQQSRQQTLLIAQTWQALTRYTMIAQSNTNYNNKAASGVVSVYYVAQCVILLNYITSVHTIPSFFSFFFLYREGNWAVIGNI
jgi:hypothetical protein